MKHIDQGLQPKADGLKYPQRNTHTHRNGLKHTHTELETNRHQRINTNSGTKKQKYTEVSHNGNFLKEPVLSDIWVIFVFTKKCPVLYTSCRNLPTDNKNPRGNSLTHSLTSSSTGGSANIKHEDQDTAEVTHQGMKTAYEKNTGWWRGRRRSEGVWVFDTGGGSMSCRKSIASYKDSGFILGQSSWLTQVIQAFSASQWWTRLDNSLWATGLSVAGSSAAWFISNDQMEGVNSHLSQWQPETSPYESVSPGRHPKSSLGKELSRSGQTKAAG